jgi:hypothetical protein
MEAAMTERDRAWAHFYPPVTRESLCADVAGYELHPGVPDEVRKRFERARSTYRASYEDYGLVAASAEQAWLTVEMAVRQRLQQAHPEQATQIQYDKRLTLDPLLRRAVKEGLLSRQWNIKLLCDQRNHIAHAKETPTFPPAPALMAFGIVTRLINELWPG